MSRRQRHLLFEHLEDRHLLSAVGWEGEDCSACALGESSSYPQVAAVDVSTPTVTSLGVKFTEPMAAQSAIDDGSILDAVSLVDVSDGPIPLAANQFSYNDGTKTLVLSFDDPLPTANYELRLNSDLLTDTDGNPLRGGTGGFVFQLPVFAAAEMVQAGGTDIQVNNFSVPSLDDWNSDGLTDLIVGEKSAATEGKIRVYLNSGTNQAPVYDTFFFAQSGGADLTVVGGGCMGVFPRMFDWNQDGLKDLVLGLADGTVKVALNENTDTNPSFAAPEPVQVGQPGSKADIDVGYRTTLAIVDWNNDGRYDLVLGDLDGNVRVLLNEADSGPADFRTETIVLDAAVQGVPTGRSSVAVADLNGDGRKDLVVGNTEGQLLFYANIGTDVAPQFADYVAIEADGTAIDIEGQPRSRLFVGDADGDGRTDLLVGAEDGYVRLYVASTGTTANYTFRVVPPWQSPVHKHDVDGDGGITVLDVLALVTHITDNGPHKLPVPPDPPNAPPPYLDCDGDGSVTTLDVLQLVTDLTAFGPRAAADGEGEAALDVYVGDSPLPEGEGAATQQSLPANVDNTPKNEPQLQPKSQPQQTDREARDDFLSALTAEDLTSDESDLEKALSEIASSLD